MSASGCASKCVASSASRSAIWRLSSAMMPTAARVLAPNAAVTAAGAASCSAAQHFLNLQGSGVEVALAPSGFERSPDLRQTQPPGVGGGGGAAQDGQRVAVGQIVERLQRGGVVLAQRAAQRVGVAGARPDQILVRPGQHLDRLGIPLSPAIRRWLCRSVRTRSANSLASEASDLAPETWWRSR